MVLPATNEFKAANYILVDTLGMPMACRVEPAKVSDQRGAERLLGGLGPMFPGIRIIMAHAGHQSRKLARQLLRQDGWNLLILKPGQRAFKITGLTWIVERSLAWLGRNGRMSKDLRIQRADFRSHDRHRYHPSYAQSPHLLLKLPKHPLSCEKSPHNV